MESCRWMCELCATSFSRKSAWVRHAKRCSPSRQGALIRSRQKACSRCVRVKSKCDLLQPVCSRCALRGAVCEYVGKAIQMMEPPLNNPLHASRQYAQSATASRRETKLSIAGLSATPIVATTPSFSSSSSSPLYQSSSSFATTSTTIATTTSSAAAPPVPGPTVATATASAVLARSYEFGVYIDRSSRQLLVSDSSQSSVEKQNKKSHLTDSDRAYGNHSGAHLPPNSAEPGWQMRCGRLGVDSGDMIRDLWINPLIELNVRGSKSAEQGMELVFGLMRTFPSMLAFRAGFGCPVVHSRQLMQGHMRLPMTNCVKLARLWGDHKQQTDNSIEAGINKEMRRLVDEHASYAEDDLLAAMQALLIYAIMLFFLPGPDRTHGTCFDLIQMDWLHQVASKFIAPGPRLDESEVCSTPPDWEDWIRNTAKARTMLAFSCFEWAFSTFHNVLSYHRHSIGLTLAPTSKTLWTATSQKEWEQEFGRWKLQWQPRGFLRMRELRSMAPGLPLSNRISLWLAETDEFGAMVMKVAQLSDHDLPTPATTLMLR